MLGQCDIPTRVPSGSRATRSCRSPPRHAGRAPGSRRSAHSPPSGPASRTRFADRATPALGGDCRPSSRRAYSRRRRLATLTTAARRSTCASERGVRIAAMEDRRLAGARGGARRQPARAVRRPRLRLRDRAAVAPPARARRPADRGRDRPGLEPGTPRFSDSPEDDPDDQRTTSASGWRTRLPSAPRATASGQRALSRRSGRTTGVSCVQVADPDGYRVEVYAHYWRHDVEKRRPASLTR
jgi:hypothetical protein